MPVNRNQRRGPRAISKAIKANHGNMSAAAKSLGVNRRTLYRYVSHNVTLLKVWNDAREELIDRAEDKLSQAVDAGEQYAVTLVVKTLGKNRGYVERHEAQQVGPQIVEIHTEDDGRGNSG